MAKSEAASEKNIKQRRSFCDINKQMEWGRLCVYVNENGYVSVWILFKWKIIKLRIEVSPSSFFLAQRKDN